jgi:hypothetical protein
VATGAVPTLEAGSRVSAATADDGGSRVRFQTRHRRPPEGASTLEYAIMLVLGAAASLVLLVLLLTS